jgi:VWFA-related protein
MMMKNPRIGLVISLLLTLPGFTSTLAQEKQSDTPIKVQTTLVSVPVIVSDREGRYVSGLKLGDFKLFQDRIEQPIAVLDAAEEPLNIALLLDTSHSTQPVLGKIKKAAGEFLKEMRAQDRAMVISFDYAVHVLSGLTSDRKVLERAIKDSRIGEQYGTTLRDAVAEVIERRFKRVEGRKAIILLTDGKDFGSQIDERDLFDEAAESGAMIYPILFETENLRPGVGGPFDFPRGGRGRWGRQNPFPPPGRPQPNERRRERVEMNNARAKVFMTQLAEVSSGRFFNSKVGDLKQTFALVAEELRHQYRLGFYPDNGKADGRRHTLRVEVKVSDAVVRARKSYQAANLANGS